MLRLPERVSRADVALAVGLAALMCVEASSDSYRQPALWVPVSALAVLALAVRRRHPFAVALVVVGVQVPLAALAPGPFAPQMPVLGVVVAVYTVAVALDGRRLWAAAALTLALLVAANALTAEGDLADFWPALIWVGPLCAGRLVRRRTLEAAAAATAAAEALAKQEAETAEAVARERDRIARELHDVVAHAVSLMVVQAGAERLALAGSSDPDRTRAALTAVEEAGREALTELRTMLAVLRAPDGGAERRSPAPDLTGLGDLVARVEAAGTPVRWRASGDLRAVPVGVALSAYRVVQEALTNAVRHAPHERVDLLVAVDPAELRIEVRNALVVAPPQPGSAKGLLGLRERAALHGGTAVAGPVDGAWVVDVRLPVPARVPV